jgi:hypothetical protein
MITAASGRPIPNEPPMINASAKSKPIPARMPHLLQVRRARITLRMRASVTPIDSRNAINQVNPCGQRKPARKATGARIKFSETAMAHLLEDWTTHGPAVLARVRQEDPSTYLRVAFNAIPKDVQLSIEQRGGPMETNEMRMLRRLVDVIDACGAANVADSETVLGWIEEDLRARMAVPVVDQAGATGRQK